MLIGQGFRLVGEERFMLGMEFSFVNPAYCGFAGTPEAARARGKKLLRGRALILTAVLCWFVRITWPQRDVS
jgi:hypothetical protein